MMSVIIDCILLTVILLSGAWLNVVAPVQLAVCPINYV
jgi:hypothetical protein